jgi:hypothetical protein
MRAIAHRAEVVDVTLGRGVLHERADGVRPELERRRVAELNRDVLHGSACLHDGDRLRVAPSIDTSSNDALAISNPVMSVIIVWKLSSASSRPCEISA